MSFESLKDDLKNPEVAGNGLQSSCSGSYEFGDFRLDAAKRLLFRKGVVVPLTPKAFDVLLLLVSRQGHVVGKDELLSHVWHDTIVEENNLNVNVSLLRKTLGEKPNDHQFIVTVPGLGYQFVAEVGFVRGENSGTEPRRPKASNSSEPQPRPIGRSAKIFLSLCLAVAIAIFAYFAYRYAVANKAPTIRSVAVLPFVNKTNDDEAEYLCEGIAESLINNLSQLSNVKVIASSSSFKYKGKAVDPRGAAGSLGVDAILTGTILRRGDQIQIGVHLIDARNNLQLWGEEYNRSATDLLSVQSEISREISESLHLRLTEGEQRQLAKRETINPVAYELLLKGRFYTNKGGTDNQKRAVEYFKQAIDVDPAYALAYASLSLEYSGLINVNVLDPREFIPKAEMAARKAVDLDDNLAEAHLAMAYVNTNAWEWAAAEREHKRAIQLNSNLAPAHRHYMFYLIIHGRNDEALAEGRRARELDPLSLVAAAPVYELLLVHQFDQAIEAAKKLLEANPSNPDLHSLVAYTYLRTGGRYLEAIAAYREGIRLGDDSTDAQIYLGEAYAKAGQTGKARVILKQLQTGKGYVSPTGLAILHAALGEKDKAFALLERAYSAHDQQLIWLGIEGGYVDLHPDPRFQDLIRRIGLPDRTYDR